VANAVSLHERSIKAREQLLLIQLARHARLHVALGRCRDRRIVYLLPLGSYRFRIKLEHMMASFDGCLDLAKAQVALRALRYGHFPADIFDEYAWDMMLHMYIAALREQKMYIDNAVNLTSKNKKVGDRWIKHLQAEGMIDVDGEVITLSERAMKRMHSYHEEALAAVQ
jgi:hypothetical protein